jgi:hypothetical protein
MGYKLKPSGHFRDETSISFISEVLMVYFFHSSVNDDFYCVIGKPDENYPGKSVSIPELLEKIGAENAQSGNKLIALSETATLLKTHFSKLLSGDISILSEIWEERESCENALREYQERIAVNTEVVGSSMILEIPNTIDSLGKSFLEQFPDHCFDRATTWLIYFELGMINCNNYDQAKKIAIDFGKN